ncbi:MAG: PAS domain S-box protein, partial [Proteobacteria bacterium]|nr:PAS domain S-box protein [Pseudomonadota bacterium]
VMNRRVELTGMRADGSEFAVELSVTRLPGAAPPGFVGFMRDITQRRQAAEALATSRARYQDLYDNAPDMFISVDARTGTVLSCNETLASTLGYSMDKLIGAPLLDLYHPDSLKEAEQAFQSFVREGEVHDARLQLRRSDGTALAVSLNVSAVRDERGEILYSRSVLRDISDLQRSEEERRRLEAQVQHAQKLESLGVLAGGIAHDFNNLLTTILGSAEMALDDLPSASEGRSWIEGLRAAVKTAANLCDQMLAYAGRGQFVIEPVDMNELVTEMSQLLAVSITKKAELEYDLAKQLPFISADAAQIRQVVLNLMTNASEAIGEGTGTIRLATGVATCDRAYLDSFSPHTKLAEGDYVYIEVSDTGCGIDEDVQRKLFDPFYTTKFTGRGLGLSVVMGILLGHRGIADVRSEPGKGSSFKLLFPAIDRLTAAPETVTAAHETIAAEAQGEPDGGKVLIVDDDDSIRAIAGNSLKAAGFEVLSAANGREAVELFGREPDQIRCVLLDLTMPEMDGREAFVELCRIRPSVRVILCSGYTEHDVVPRFLGRGPTGFLKKPYGAQELLAKLREALRS